MYEVILPKLEANTEEAKISEWLKKEGEWVEKGEPVFIMETVKAAIEIVAEVSGILRKILVPINVTVPILTVVALIGTAKNQFLKLLYCWKIRG